MRRPCPRLALLVLAALVTQRDAARAFVQHPHVPSAGLQLHRPPAHSMAHLASRGRQAVAGTRGARGGRRDGRPPCLALRASAGESDADIAAAAGGIEVREWASGDVAAIRELLTVAHGFDPEGDTSTDCASADALRLAYTTADDNDESCFLVACAAGAIVGTAALTTGLQVTMLASGASVSTGATGALRRAAVSLVLSQDAQEAVFGALLSDIERRAIRGGCSRILALGYHADDAAAKCRRLSSQQLAASGYAQGDVLPGTQATQFVKTLSGASDRVAAAASVPAEEGLKRAARLLVGRGSGVLIIGALALTLVAAVGVASLLGLDLGLGNDDNRGVGTPLTTAEVRQMMQDEKLKRKSLDSEETGDARGWEDLSPEERREEQALMRVISGGDIRVK